MPEGDPLRYITQVAQNAPNSHRFTCSHSFFGRFPAAMCAKRGRRRETIESLGFKHVCGVDRSGKFAVVRILSVKSCRKILHRTREWSGKHGHWLNRDQQYHLWAMLRGFYQYFGLHHCTRKRSWVRQQVQRQWAGLRRRRSPPSEASSDLGLSIQPGMVRVVTFRCDPCSPRCPWTIRTARLRTSGEYLSDFFSP